MSDLIERLRLIAHKMRCRDELTDEFWTKKAIDRIEKLEAALERIIKRTDHHKDDSAADDKRDKRLMRLRL